LPNNAFSGLLILPGNLLPRDRRSPVSLEKARRPLAAPAKLLALRPGFSRELSV